VTRLALLLALVACSWELNRMNDQPRCEPGDRRPWLPDQRCDQDPPAGTIVWRAAAVAQPAPTRELIARGRDRFARICAPCHGSLGDGSSVIALDMVLRPPPSLLVPPDGRSVPTDLQIVETVPDEPAVEPPSAPAARRLQGTQARLERANRQRMKAERQRDAARRELAALRGRRSVRAALAAARLFHRRPR
jgi:mono/diheme cytochrome c family protein